MSPKKTPTKKELMERVAKLEKELESAKNLADQYLNQLKYAKADLENLRKQSQKRAMEMVEKANGELLKELLPILDELELIQKKGHDTEAYFEGVGMVYKKLLKILESQKVERIPALGERFDPFRHEALMEVETTSVPEGHVVEEIRPGYMFRGQLLRASLVKVAKNPEVVEIKIEGDECE